MSCLIALALVFNAKAGQEVELIDGDVLSHFHSAKGWTTVETVEADSNNLRTTPHSGSGGILNNGTTKAKFDHIFTKDEFSDVAVSIEFMLPEGSNSGVYFLGRYEIQLLDSFGIESPTYNDLGGLYQRWDNMQPRDKKGYEGIAPKVNASKAAGEWQKLEVVFRAPRFNQHREKTAYARFESVHVNGVLVQKDIVAKGPTRSHQLIGEATSGPIVIQGDHGPIAIRSFKVKPLDAAKD